ncbi:MAG: VOC family protein [Deltaproteobacteria bacterium]|nr:VOC family protein [Deltaproteobacteria bacterium]
MERKKAGKNVNIARDSGGEKQFIRGLGHQAINVKDLGRSKRFYVDVLGLRVLHEDAMRVFLKVGEGENFGILALLAKPADGLEPVDPSLRQGNKYNHFGFRARAPEEVYEFAEHLKSHGVTILKGPYTRKDGTSIYFLDPDGYTLEHLHLIENPAAHTK